MSIKETLKQLQALQQIDVQILELRRTGEAHPQRLAELDQGLASARSAVEASRARLLDNEKARREKQNDIQAEKDKIKKWEARLAEQRTTREYTALAREIDIAKKAVLNAEEEVQALGEQGEQLKRAVMETEQELRRQEDATGAERAQLAESIASLAGQVRELEEKRELAAQGIDPGFASRYEAIRKKRSSGLALVVNGICKGCNMRLPPQLTNMLRAASTVENCPSCQRLIFVPEILEKD